MKCNNNNNSNIPVVDNNKPAELWWNWKTTEAEKGADPCVQVEWLVSVVLESFGIPGKHDRTTGP